MKATFRLLPHVGVGPINFNDTRESARAQLGEDYEVFTRSPSSLSSADHYFDLGVFVYYDDEGLVEAVELTRPAELFLNEKEILNRSCLEVLELVLSCDLDLERGDDGFISYQLGLSAYMPGSPESIDIPESLLAFRPGYYNNDKIE